MTNYRLWIVAALGLLLVGWIVVPRFFPAETRIRWTLEDAIESFNAARAGGVVAPLADDWTDAATRADKEVVRGWLVATFLRKENRHDGGFRYPASVKDGVWTIELTGDDGVHARATFQLEFRDAREGETSEPVWTVDVALELEERAGDWVVTKSTIEPVSGRRPV